MIKFVGAMIFTLLYAVLLSAIQAEPGPESPKPAPLEGATVSGQATIELRINRTKSLGGLQLALIPESAVAELKEIRNRRWLESASRLKFNAGYYYLDLKSIGYFAKTNAVQTTKANNKGLYQFSGITPGYYRIYGQYKSRYASGYWLIPIEVKSKSDQITIDINNENLEEIYNLDLR